MILKIGIIFILLPFIILLALLSFVMLVYIDDNYPWLFWILFDLLLSYLIAVNL